MIYLIGGAPRAGKSSLCRRISSELNIGWISTDLLMELLTLERFDRFPRHSPGYAFLPEATRRQFAQDIPLWSEFIRQETERFGYPYVDMSNDFHLRLSEAGAVLTAGAFPEGGDGQVQG